MVGIEGRLYFKFVYILIASGGASFCESSIEIL
jgi:hypothetical protein